MATKTWGNVAGNWSDGTKWVEGSKPAAGDDVIIASSANCVVNEATANLKSFDMTGYTGTLSGTFVINIIGAASSTDVVKFAGTISWNRYLNINPTASDTVIQVTSNGKTLRGITINGNASGTVFLLDNINFGEILTLTQGILHTDGLLDNSGLTHSMAIFDASSTSVKTIYLGNSTINIDKGYGETVPAYINVSSSASTTLYAGTSTINASVIGDFYGGGKTYNNVNITYTPAYASTITGSNTFNNFSKNGELLIFSDNQTILNTLTITGASSTARLWARSNSIGQSITITCATLVTSNADFQGITGAGTGDWNLANIVGGSGDCSGNSGITFTPATNWYWHQGTGSWSDSTKWWTQSNGLGSNPSTGGSARPPLPQDNCYFDANSFDATSTVTANMPRMGKDIDWSNSTQTTTWTSTTGYYIYGSLDLTNLNTLNFTSFQFYGDSASTLNTGTVTLPQGIAIAKPNGSLTLLSNLSIASAYGQINFTAGTFDANDFDVTVAGFSAPASTYATSILNMGSGTWNVNYGANAWRVGTSSQLTVNSETSTVSLTGNLPEFYGGDRIYNNVIFSSISSIYAGIRDSNTFDTLTINTTKIIYFQALETNTIYNLVTIGTTSISGAAGGLAYVSSPSGTISVKNCTIAKLNAIGGASWEAFTVYGNVDGGNNTGWQFSPDATKTYCTVSSTEPDLLDYFVKGALVGRWSSA